MLIVVGMPITHYVQLVFFNASSGHRQCISKENLLHGESCSFENWTKRLGGLDMVHSRHSETGRFGDFHHDLVVVVVDSW